MALICSFIKILDRGSPITFVIEHLIVQREALVQARAPEVQFVCLFLLTAVQVMIPVSSTDIVPVTTVVLSWCYN